MKKHLNKILTVFLILTCVSCGIKNNSLNSKQLNKDKTNKATYKFENQKAWLELKQLLAKDLMSNKGLRLADCRGYERDAWQLSRLKEFSYLILDHYYDWMIYQRKDEICVEVLIYKNVEDLIYKNNLRKTFFLTPEDSQVLISASEGYHFDILGLQKPKILSDTIFFNSSYKKFCKTGGTRFLKNKMIYTDNCKQRTLYSYNGKYPELERLKTSIKINEDIHNLPDFSIITSKK